MDRRLAIKWILAAGAGALLADPLLSGAARAGAPPGAAPEPGSGYGRDPDLMKAGRPDEYWPLMFTDALRREAAALCDVILPADERSPAASALGVQDFIDEWVSAPYPENTADRPVILEGLAWLDEESVRRYGRGFADAGAAEKAALCSELAAPAPDASELAPGSRFFRKFRSLVASGFYTTPAGMKDLGYVGNVPLAKFDGPPADLVARLGLADEVKW
jgi:hypothetical protein